MKLKNNIVPIPKKGITQKLFNGIVDLLPSPPQRPGFKFSHYGVVSLSQINTKDKAKNIANSVRVRFETKSNDDDTLKISLAKGLDITKVPPTLYPNFNAGDGFNRIRDLRSLGYEQWIFAFYVPNEQSRNEFQSSNEDALEDFRMSLNANDGKRPCSEDEILEHVRKRMTEEWDKTKIKKFIHSLDLNLSGSKVDGISNTIDRERKRKGVVKPISAKEAEEFIQNNGIGALYFNTKAGASVQRTAISVVKSINASKSPVKICTFSSSAISHDQIDQDHDESTDQLHSVIDDLIKFGLEAAQMKMRGENPIEVIGSVPQKIIKDQVMPTTLVQYGSKKTTN